MFNHINWSRQLVDLETINKEGKRFYVTPDGIFASVTTILANSGSETGPLVEWKNRIGEEEAAKELKRAGARGTRSHAFIEKYLQNDLDVKTLNYFDKDRFKKVKPVLDKHINNIYFQEAPLYEKLVRSAGRVDLVAEYDGALSIIDFKTKNSFYPGEYKEYYKQVSAYAFMLANRVDLLVKQGVVIYIIENQEKCEVEIVNPGKWLPLFLRDSRKFYENNS